METYNLSMKNLYRILTSNDYPIYTNGVLSEKNKKGMTLTSFWKDSILPVLQTGTTGRRIWSEEAQKARSLAHLINRREDFPFYMEYMHEISAVLKPEMMLRQVLLFRDFLNERKYRSEVLRRKLQFFMELQDGDPLIGEEERKTFLFWLKGSRGQSMPNDFLDAWLFAMFTFSSMAGNEEAKSRFYQLLRKQDLKPDTLYARMKELQQHALPLSGRGNVFFNGEKLDRMFGRERELFDLEEAVRMNRKVVITGLAGIGKTELLRHLASSDLVAEHHQIVQVAYRDSILTALGAAFTGLSGKEAEEKFYEAIYLLRHAEDVSPVLLIDNARFQDGELKAWEEIRSLPFAVIVTSREEAPGMYDQMRLQVLDEESALLIFRRFFDRSLDDQDQEQIRDVFAARQIEHPLTVRILAHAASWHGWSVPEIVQELRGRLAEISWKEHTAEHRLGEVYSRLYADENLPEEERLLARVFAVIPYGLYTGEMAAGLAGIRENESKVLRNLVARGWIERQDSRYRMHPFVAECIADEGFAEAELSALFKEARRQMPERIAERHGGNEAEADRPYFKITEIILSAVRHVRGPVSSALAELTADALSLNDTYALALPSAQAAELALSLLERCDHPSGNTRALLLKISAMFDQVHLEKRVEDYLDPAYLQEAEDYYYVHYGTDLSAVLVYAGKFTDAERVIQRAGARSQDPRLHAYVLMIESVIASEQYRMAEAIEKLQQFIRFCRTASVTDILFGDVKEAIVKLAQIYLIHGDAEAARRELEELNKLPETGKSGFGANNLLILRGFLARAEGDLFSAEQYMKEALELAERYFGKHHPQYLTDAGELAIILAAEGKCEEALEIYEEIIQELRKTVNKERISVTLNNAGVACISAGKYERAIDYLNEAYAMAVNEGMAPIQQAEPACNLAKVYKATGDPEKEREYLKIAEPVFMEVYGPEHPKTKYVKEHLMP